MVPCMSQLSLIEQFLKEYFAKMHHVQQAQLQSRNKIPKEQSLDAVLYHARVRSSQSIKQWCEPHQHGKL